MSGLLFLCLIYKLCQYFDVDIIMKVLVIGASANPSRTSNQALHMLTQYEHEVVAIGSKLSTVAGINILDEWPENLSDIHTVTLYINPSIQPHYYDYILDLKPERVIFNPGTENPQFMKTLIQSGIHIEEACTLVMLRTRQF